MSEADKMLDAYILKLVRREGRFLLEEGLEDCLRMVKGAYLDGMNELLEKAKEMVIEAETNTTYIDCVSIADLEALFK